MVSTNLISQILHDFCDNLLNVWRAQSREEI